MNEETRCIWVSGSLRPCHCDPDVGPVTIVLTITILAIFALALLW